MPFSIVQLIIFLFVVGTLLALVQIGILTVAFDKLGLSQHSAFLLLFASLFGSGINLPLLKVAAERPAADTVPEPMRELFERSSARFTGTTVIGVNVGGCLIPLFFSYYLMRHNPLEPLVVALAVLIVGSACYATSRPIPGIGIAMPIFVAPLAAAITAIVLDHNNSAPLAYICGTLGVLIGADVMRLGDIRKMGAPTASIGGAGTFDGIFITGIVAVLLA